MALIFGTPCIYHPMQTLMHSHACHLGPSLKCNASVCLSVTRLAVTRERNYLENAKLKTNLFLLYLFGEPFPRSCGHDHERHVIFRHKMTCVDFVTKFRIAHKVEFGENFQYE